MRQRHSVPLSPEQRKLRAQIAAKARRRPPDDPELVADRRAFEASRFADHIEQLLAAAPPLTDGQRARLAVLLRPARDPASERQVPA